MSVRKIILNNFWLKTLSLVLALVTWVYISEVVLREKGGEESPLSKIISTYRYVSKELAVEPVFIGRPPSGYELVRDGVDVQPKHILVIGPSSLIRGTKSAKTKNIDLSEYTRTTTTEVGISPISKHIDIGKVSVKITIPIRKVTQ